LAYRLASTKHSTYKAAYEATTLLRLLIEDAGRLQLKIAGVVAEGYEVYETELLKQRNKNRRGRTAYLGLDPLIRSCLKSHARRRGDRPRDRARRPSRGTTTPDPAPAIDGDTVSSGGSAHSTRPYRRRK
jgi:hypothetical protein